MSFHLSLTDNTDIYRYPKLASLARSVDNVLTASPGGLEFVGVAPLFDEPRLYRGADSDWLFGPAATDPQVTAGSFPIPDAQLRFLRELVDQGIDFPAVYIAHELDPARTASILGVSDTTKPGSAVALTTGEPRLSADKVAALVGLPPAPLSATRQATRLGQVAELVGTTLAKAVPIMLAAGALPLMIGSAAVVGLAACLDPIVIGAVTADGNTEMDTPAAWFVLARWQW